MSGIFKVVDVIALLRTKTLHPASQLLDDIQIRLCHKSYIQEKFRSTSRRERYGRLKQALARDRMDSLNYMWPRCLWLLLFHIFILRHLKGLQPQTECIVFRVLNYYYPTRNSQIILIFNRYNRDEWLPPTLADCIIVITTISYF